MPILGAGAMRKLLGGFCLCWLLTQGSVAQVIQLPSYRVFSIQTSGVVPDQGTAVVGGVRRGPWGAEVKVGDP